MSFVPFPSTPHLRWLSGRSVRGEKVLDEAQVERLLAGPVVVEEKADGDNLGFSVVAGELRVQHRGDYVRLDEGRGYPRLASWIALHERTLREALSDRFVLFGEWCAARHAVTYDRLPDWLLAFDLFDRQSDCFVDTAIRDLWCARHALETVPRLGSGRFTLGALERLLQAPSHLGPERMEGLVVRRESHGRLHMRAKLVRPDHVQPDEPHWRSRPVEPNRLASDS